MRERSETQAPPAPQAPALAPSLGAALPTALDAATVISLQQTSGNAAVTRLLSRAPAPPAGLTRDRSQVHIVPGRGATDPMDYVEFTSQERHTEVVAGQSMETEDAREFDYESSPWNLSATWRYYDGADRLVHTISDMPRAIAIWPANIREHVGRTGRSAFGTWTVRLEKDRFYDDVHFDVTEGARPAGAPLEGTTTESFFNLREFPSATSRRLGALTGQSVAIRATDKAKAEGHTWYRVTLGAPVGSLPAGTVGWIVADAVTLVTPWDTFRTQLAAWETANATMTLDARITRLRQMCHNSDLPFDAVIGTAPGREYADTRRFQSGEWELLRDSQQVTMPDGQVVDVYHLLVGLDVLPRRNESTDVSVAPLMSRNVGQNYSAATWSGDIGAAAADAFVRQDAEWERQNPTASPADRIHRYYDTRVANADLLGDVDAWGIDAARAAPGAPTTIEGLLAAYYGAPVTTTGPGGAPNTSRRKGAVERFARHYGFSVGGPSAAFPDQAAPRAAMAHQIELFAHVWVERRDYFRSIDGTLVSDYVEPMTDVFLRWLDALAAQVGAGTP
ncbi:hypothetical protein OM076_03455 [Solirubrobacter ginsenosidimutans]|uniref:SH3b domain-containing protein n=1 Tax=Solirubrobacter ginsenosidimutans TaxID=490573 RepID=A0A9X3MPB0_9ACTN|nr:hypothetical protein [Solirubrobacter ginsenosidimutans]MDA0159311.1 hypothetical protein [Solirubrobacter ginsenosidimutans]